MQTTITRPDEDILADIHTLFSTYPPLQHDRHAVHIEVSRGVVTLKGYIKASPTYRYLQAHLPNVAGVRYIDADRLYDDEAIRRQVGKVLPLGVQVRMEYGTAILTGRLSEGVTAEEVVQRVASIEGVARVITAFM